MSFDSKVQQRDMSVRSITASLVLVADGAGWAVNLRARLIPAPPSLAVLASLSHDTNDSQKLGILTQDPLSLADVLRPSLQEQRLIVHMDLLEDEVHGQANQPLAAG